MLIESTDSMIVIQNTADSYLFTVETERKVM